MEALECALNTLKIRYPSKLAATLIERFGNNIEGNTGILTYYDILTSSNEEPIPPRSAVRSFQVRANQHLEEKSIPFRILSDSSTHSLSLGLVITSEAKDDEKISAALEKVTAEKVLAQIPILPEQTFQSISGKIMIPDMPKINLEFPLNADSRYEMPKLLFVERVIDKDKKETLPIYLRSPGQLMIIMCAVANNGYVDEEVFADFKKNFPTNRWPNFQSNYPNEFKNDSNIDIHKIEKINSKLRNIFPQDLFKSVGPTYPGYCLEGNYAARVNYINRTFDIQPNPPEQITPVNRGKLKDNIINIEYEIIDLRELNDLPFVISVTKPYFLYVRTKSLDPSIQPVDWRLEITERERFVIESMKGLTMGVRDFEDPSVKEPDVTLWNVQKSLYRRIIASGHKLAKVFKQPWGGNFRFPIPES